MALLGKRKRKKWQKATQGKLETKEDVLLRQQRFSNNLARSAIAVFAVLIVSGMVAERWFYTGAFTPAQAAVFAGLVFTAGVLGWLGLARFFPEALSTVASFHRLVGTLLVFALVLKGLSLFSVPAILFLAPIPLLAMTSTLMYSRHLAGYLVVYCSLLTVLMCPGLHDFAAHTVTVTPAGTENPPPPSPLIPPVNLTLLLAMLLSGLVAVLSTGRMRSQSRPVAAGFFAGLAAAAVIAACDFIGGAASYPHTLKRPLFGFTNGLMCGVIMTSILPALEQIFDILTERRLRELADLSNDLLRTFTKRAPGSFTHSLNVAHLASEAAATIGADPLLARVGAYYHDVGKILKPEYFVENTGGSPNPHDRISPEMSRLVIVSHVKDGLGIAEEEGLPPKVAAMIPMHHGTSVVTYFYRKAKDQADVGGRHDTDMESYRYPGPKPSFKEAGILMLADAVEAASRVLGDPTAPRLKSLVHELIRKRLREGELDDSELTMRDLWRIEQSFLRTLSTQIFHGRIPYPKEEKREDRSGDEDSHNGKHNRAPDKPSADT